MISTLLNKFRRITSNQLYFPEIDGIRFVAIVLVILFHTHGYFVGKSNIVFTDNPDSYHLLNTFLQNGDRGVELFFVLSGFILCLPFAQQFIKNGKPILLSKYYLRRLTRLEPPYILALTLIFLLQLAAHARPLEELWPSWLASLIYSHGLIFHHTPLLTVVAWSLEVEIQFYLLAPFLFRLLKLNAVTRRLILAAATIALIYFQSVYTPPFRNIFNYAQYFFVGILLADFHVTNIAAAFFNQKWIVAFSALLLTAICLWTVTPYSNSGLDYAVFRLAFPAMIGLFYYTVLKNDIVKRIFSYKFIPIIGGMCYSVYLLHYTIISMFGRFTMGIHFTNYYLPNLLLQTLLLSIPILLISGAFYYYVERPFMSSKWTELLMKKRVK